MPASAAAAPPAAVSLATRPLPLASRFPEADRIARSRWGLTGVAVVATLTRYPLRYGMAYGRETCRLVVSEGLRVLGG